MGRPLLKLIIQKRRAVAVLLALFLSAAYLWQGFHFHGDVAGELKIESSCACKLAPNPSQGLRPQIHCGSVDFSFSDHPPIPVSSLVSEERWGSTAIRAPPVAA